MQKELIVTLPAAEANNDTYIRKQISATTAIAIDRITGYYILKKSLDARGRQVKLRLAVKIFIDEPVNHRKLTNFHFDILSADAPRVIVVGAGPAGLFAALCLITLGIKPVILERGKNVRARRRDLAALNKTGEINPESNYCFGEGGAGTYSDGKLYTRSGKRGDINRILELFHHFGAGEEILFDAHPHIGTNKLPHIISAITKTITNCGGEVHFESKVSDLLLDKNDLKGVYLQNGEKLTADAVILATGHSARDIFELLHRKGILIQAKHFALGVRIEHPQSHIDALQYHCDKRPGYLPPASYSLVEQVDQQGVFSFCMCPGGIIAPASTSAGELVVNGWSPSKRNNPYANSGLVVQVAQELIEIPDDFEKITGQPKKIIHSPLGLLYFQQYVERKAFIAGGGKMVAPAQRMIDFSNKKISSDLPACSYLPGVKSADLQTVLPPFIHHRLSQAFKLFGEKMKSTQLGISYFTNEAIVVATESRTSSPVRIPRDVNTLAHPQINGLYPCAEGAGYAGGIVSAAMDGERVAKAIALKLGKNITIDNKN